MSRTMEKIIPVKITTDEINCYATIQRSMITATTAALRLKDNKAAELFKKQRIWASEKYDEALARHIKATK